MQRSFSLISRDPLVEAYLNCTFCRVRDRNHKRDKTGRRFSRFDLTDAQSRRLLPSKKPAREMPRAASAFEPASYDPSQLLPPAFAISIKRPCSHAGEGLEKIRGAPDRVQMALEKAHENWNGRSRRLGAYTRLRSRLLARSPACLLVTCSPCSLELCSCPYDTKTRLQARRFRPVAWVSAKFARARASFPRWSRLAVLDPPDNGRSVAHRHGNKAPCYPANTVIARCAHNGTRRRPTRRFVSSVRGLSLGILDEGRWFRERILTRLRGADEITRGCLSSSSSELFLWRSRRSVKFLASVSAEKWNIGEQ